MRSEYKHINDGYLDNTGYITRYTKEGYETGTGTEITSHLLYFDKYFYSFKSYIERNSRGKMISNTFNGNFFLKDKKNITSKKDLKDALTKMSAIQCKTCKDENGKKIETFFNFPSSIAYITYLPITPLNAVLNWVDGLNDRASYSNLEFAYLLNYNSYMGEIFNIDEKNNKNFVLETK